MRRVKFVQLGTRVDFEMNETLFLKGFLLYMHETFAQTTILQLN